MPSDLIEKLYDLSFTAGMSQRYHQSAWTQSEFLDTGVQVFVGVFAVIGFIYSMYGYFKGSDKAWLVAPVIKWITRGRYEPDYNAVSVFTAILSLIAATVLNITPTNKSVSYHADLFRRWSELRRDVDDLDIMARNEKSSITEDELTRRYQELLARKNVINSLEKSAKRSDLIRFYEDENEYRTGFRTEEDKRKAEIEETNVAVPSDI